jgi:uncharacterized membrane protein YphA (DoxX/SURF4 family)
LELAPVRKILTFPLRLSVGWGISPRLLGVIGIVMLVLLRLTIGFHFYSEGVEKYRTGTWSAVPFFANARGPLEDHYHALVWDHDGAMRQDMEEVKLWLATYRDEVAEYYGFDKEQVQQAKLNYVAAVTDHEQVLLDNAVALQEYNLGVQRLKDMKVDPARSGGGLAEQRTTVWRENEAKLQPVLSQIEQVWKNYEVAQNELATAEQQKLHPPLYMGKPRISLIDTNIINAIVPYFDLTIGICLLLGLFTPLAALAAAGFLGSVFLSQFPPITGPTSTYYQLVECMACLVLAGTAAGRFAGLDFFLHLIVRKEYGNPAEEE